MENISLSRPYLESLSTGELIRLGDEFGVDIPEELSRSLIIGELLEIQEDFRSSSRPAFEEFEQEKSEKAAPGSYNETKVNILLRNPGWVFVFWDFSAAEFSACTSRRSFESFGLRVSFFDNSSLTKSRDSYNIAVSPSDRKRYIHIPEQRCFCRVDLIAMNAADRNFVLAQSNALCIPPAAGIEIPKSGNEGIPPILSLSGIEELRRKYRRNHRQSFP